MKKFMVVDTINKPKRGELESGFSSNLALQITIKGGKMNRKKILSTVFIFMFLMVSFWLSAEESKNSPVAVSPGSDTEAVSIWQSCPTFSWSAVGQATSYRIAVFEVVDPKVLDYDEMVAMAAPALSNDIPGPALSWTLSSEKSLKTGSIYAWYVQAIDAYGNVLGNWSSGKIFKVEQEIRFAGIEERLAEKMREYGVNEEIINNVLTDIKSGVKEFVVRSESSLTSIKSSPERSEVKGTEGTVNTFYGQYAGNSITSGFNNTFIGNRAGYSTNNGYNNTFLGQSAGYSNTTGYSNTFLGYDAGNGNTEGYENTFIGRGAGFNNTTGKSNTFLGFYAGSGNTTGNYNTILGYAAGNSNTTGDGNTFIGYEAGKINTSGITNTFIGYSAGRANTTGSQNIFFGYSAGFANTTGSHNTFLGNWAGGCNTTGINNLFLGESAGYHNITGSTNIFIGYDAGFTNTGGVSNTILGNSAGFSNTIGNDNTFIGNFAGKYNTTGNNNTFVGNYAGYNNTIGPGNIFLGYQAGYNETGSNKLYIANSDTSSPLIYGEFDNSIVAINGKLGVGTKTPLGTFEIEKTGSNAVFIFERTDGAQGKFTARPGEVYIGSGSNHNVQIVANNNVVMTLTPGGNVGIGTNTPSYPLHMSSGAYCSPGGTWTNASSRSLKENIQSLSTAEAMEALNQLNPVKYNYKVDETDRHVGFIAEDAPELVATADRTGLSPMDITAVLTRVVQEQQKMIREQQQVNRGYKKIITDLQERMARIEKDDF